MLTAKTRKRVSLVANFSLRSNAGAMRRLGTMTVGVFLGIIDPPRRLASPTVSLVLTSSSKLSCLLADGRARAITASPSHLGFDYEGIQISERL